MMAKVSTITMQWLVAIAFLAWCCVLMVVILGEDYPETNMSIWEFLLFKVMGMGSAYSTYKAGVWCHERGLFPTIFNKWAELCEAEED